MRIDVQKVADVLRDAAVAEVLSRFGRLGAEDIRVKSEATDLVTEADEAAERFLRKAFSEIMPGALFVGEESAASDPSLLDALREAELAVVVDPIDGTANFVAGLPLFNVVAAITRRGEAVAGLMYDPITCSWVVAERGSGAFRFQPDGGRSRLRVADPVPLRDMNGFVAIGDLSAAIKPGVLLNLAQLRMFSSFRCASHEYRALAGGYVHFAMYNILNPWDHLAGTLISSEAGGYAACADGSPYTSACRSGMLVTATDEGSWHNLMDKVFNG